jgi:hypothetical protein
MDTSSPARHCEYRDRGLAPARETEDRDDLEEGSKSTYLAGWHLVPVPSTSTMKKFFDHISIEAWDLGQYHQ